MNIGIGIFVFVVLLGILVVPIAFSQTPDYSRCFKYKYEKPEYCDLRGANFQNFTLNGIVFQSADLSGIDFTGASLDHLYFEGITKLDGAIFKDAKLFQDYKMCHIDPYDILLQCLIPLHHS